MASVRTMTLYENYGTVTLFMRTMTLLMRTKYGTVTLFMITMASVTLLTRTENSDALRPKQTVTLYENCET